mmetsp:Transcript_39785/g.88425  ORF Transcript_39785/g.88425 Transcript_39785/m.88425 type:complete len:1123 (+) Transcript_39785:142-3510(+)|eukprot:CAMPEP_0202901502 /NCGR_PEP_ID=MMETSP1392-20130828/14286_1 /ASSEMBLY_ACC=CAM_ASM_000868 /TAXON_ID=225041 /ORGANISM="Chlamydomonas chlamydogama, Strain SAG 11-48b" /LENGTH=1122 /DNA_ID=CAMNT_0049588067 /DNA_START=90 /DNA_END=3458 /DNA_ORIENTATION=-
MSKTVFMRGLQNFISDIRACQNKEQEQKRVDKELAKIREKFGDDKSLSGYDRRKYVWKLLYIYMLGYDIDFGHKQACDLIPMPKYKDKQVGYMACSLLMHENDEFLRLAINGVHMDLTSRNEAFECLALSFVGNVGGIDMAEALTQDILKLLSSGTSRPIVKKRAALCLLKMIRKVPSDQMIVNPDTFCSTMAGLLEERDLGLLLSAVTLLHGILARNGPAGYETCQSRVIKVLDRMVNVREKDIGAEYLYYQIPAPWLQCKCLRTLQFFPAPDGADRALLDKLLTTIIDRTGTSDPKTLNNPNLMNALYAILFEAITLSVHIDTDRKLLTSCVAALSKFLTYKEPNIKYLALENLSRLALLPDILAAIRHQQPTVVGALRDPDVSIRKRAMDLLFTMCDASNAAEVVDELLKYLVVADFSMREELVLKIAVLAEKFAPSVQWYVDVSVQLLEKAGDFVSDDIWHRVVQLVTNNESMQPYAARNIVTVLKRGAMHESLVCTAAYILGEYGRLITAETPAAEQFRLLHATFPPASQPTKGLLMTSFVKLYLLDPQNQALKRDVVGLFERYQRFMDAELQQRSAEYLALADNPQAATQRFVLPMPKWPERESTLLRQLQKHEGVDEDAAAKAALTAASSAPAFDGVSTAALMAPPLAAPAPAPITPQASVDLLGAALPASSANGDPFFGTAATASSSAAVPAQPPRPSNPVDLLSDLFADTLTTAPPAPAPAPVAPPAVAPFPGTAAPAMAAGGLFGSDSAPAPVPGVAPVYGVPPQPAMPAPGLAGMSSAPQPGVFAPPSTSVSYPASGGPLAGPSGFPPAPGPTSGSQGGFGAPAASANPFGDNPFGGDPFGDNAFGAPVPVPPPMPQFEPAKPTGDIARWYSNLLVKDRGILYEDQYLQVGVQSKYTAGRGEFVLFMGNKNSDYALQQVSVVATGNPSVQLTLTPPPAQLGAKQQVQVPIQVVCMGPIVEAPVLRLGYVLSNVVVAQDLRIPLASHKFITPEAMIPRETFFEQWKAFSAPPSKAQEMVERAAPISIEGVLAVMRLANLGVEPGYLDPSPYNGAGAGFFHAGPTGSEHNVLVMSRVEGNPQNMTQFRVTVSSPNPQLAATTKDLIVHQLKSA